MDRRHGLLIALAIGLAANAGTYAALQTTDLGAQAASVSEQEIAAADGCCRGSVRIRSSRV